jgi:uncharacterized membrane protein
MKLTQLTETDKPSLEKKTLLTQWISRISYIGLFVFFSVWYLIVIAQEAHALWSVWLFHCLPLLAFAPFLVNGSTRGHVWLCFVLLIYFNGAILMCAAGGEQLIGGLIYTFLVCTLFTSSMMYSRWASQLIRLNRQLATP